MRTSIEKTAKDGAPVGLALLDADRPDVVLARSNEWIFGPDAPYERMGDVDQVVFACGWILLEDKDTVRVYYGAADTSICLATARLDDLLDAVLGAPGSGKSALMARAVAEWEPPATRDALRLAW